MTAIKKIISLIAISLSIFVYQNCTPFDGGVEFGSSSSEVSFFVGLYEKVIEPKCLECHSGSSPQGGLNLSTYATIAASNTVVAGNALGSSLYTALLNAEIPEHDTLNAQELEGLANWINAGARENELPVVNAGANRSLLLPASSLQLSGQASDLDGQIVSYAWTQTAGPNSSTLANQNTQVVSISNLVEGNYTFTLTVTDNLGGVGTDTVDVSVSLASNVPPTVNAGANRNVTSPTSTATITASASDSDGTIASYLWTQVSGPNTATLTGATTATISLSNLIDGTYVFNIRVTDNRGGAANDQVSVIVAPQAANVNPTVNAGNNRNITLPTNSVTITATASDSDGTIASRQWTKVSGPAATLGGATTLTLTASALVEGTYVFRLTVTDDRGGTGMDDVTVVVAAAPAAPTFSQLQDQVFFRCTGCHGSNGGYSMMSYNSVMSRVDPGNASNSELYDRVTDNSMPPGTPLNQTDKNLIRDWINAGALDN